MATHPVAALMSIKRPYSTLILNGTKKVELRRIPMRRDVSHVVIYESGGTGMVVGYFEVSQIIEEKPANIWRKYKATTGLTKREFDAYYANRDRSVAIVIRRAVRLKAPRPLSAMAVQRPPQSFQYLDREAFVQMLPQAFSA